MARRAIRAAARAKDNPADLINVALEELVRARLELPGRVNPNWTHRSPENSGATSECYGHGRVADCVKLVGQL